MVLIGLTGGIGSGKSTVSALLAQRGAAIIDADAITRSLQAPGQPVLAAMVERFGPDILQADGTLDRQAVANIVFTNAEALADLNAIVHPAVGAEIARRLEEESRTDHLVILDVPLLVESGRSDLTALIVVDVDPELAVQRLVEQRNMPEADARARMSRQVSRQERLEKADFVIDNNGDRESLSRQVDQAWQWISQHHSADKPNRSFGPISGTPSL